jgi:hypothetical protein
MPVYYDPPCPGCGGPTLGAVSLCETCLQVLNSEKLVVARFGSHWPAPLIETTEELAWALNTIRDLPHWHSCDVHHHRPIGGISICDCPKKDYEE